MFKIVQRPDSQAVKHLHAAAAAPFLCSFEVLVLPRPLLQCGVQCHCGPRGTGRFMHTVYTAQLVHSTSRPDVRSPAPCGYKCRCCTMLTTIVGGAAGCLRHIRSSRPFAAQHSGARSMLGSMFRAGSFCIVQSVMCAQSAMFAHPLQWLTGCAGATRMLISVRSCPSFCPWVHFSDVIKLWGAAQSAVKGCRTSSAWRII